MKSLHKVLRLSGLILLLFLASIGVSIGGGVPVPFSKRKENTTEIKIELVESKDDKKDSTQDLL